MNDLYRAEQVCIYVTICDAYIYVYIYAKKHPDLINHAISRTICVYVTFLETLLNSGGRKWKMIYSISSLPPQYPLYYLTQWFSTPAILNCSRQIFQNSP